MVGDLAGSRSNWKAVIAENVSSCNAFGMFVNIRCGCVLCVGVGVVVVAVVGVVVVVVVVVGCRCCC